jgi:hypothetical protein
MKQILFFIIISIFATSFTACSSAGGQSPKYINGKPAWISNPHKHPEVIGKPYGFGEAGANVEGKKAQKISAFTDALDQIARQMGVKIESTTQKNSLVIDKFGTQTTTSESIQTVDGKVIHARTVETYYDRRADKFYVLMVGENK